MNDMKKALAAATLFLVAITLLPALLASGDTTPRKQCAVGGPVNAILATSRDVESGGNYQAEAAGSSASGAYQFLDTTWNGYGGYTRAADAPAAVQDARAAQDVHRILDNNHGDIAAVPVFWYIGHVPSGGSPEWDVVPGPSAGNRLTPRQYQRHWLAVYRTHLGAGPRQLGAPMSTTSGAEHCSVGGVTPIAGGWSLPGPRKLLDVNPSALARRHHDYAAWDWGIPSNTPIYAVRGGTVATVRNWPHNWFDEGCGTNGGGACDKCGVGVTITDAADNRWTYCHGNAVATVRGAIVKAGQQIMWSGDTGRSTGPHLHLQISTPDGQRRCPQPLVASLYRHRAGIDPATLPTIGCSY